MSSSPLQHIPKSVNGEGVKSTKQENRSSAPDGQLCFCCKQPGHLKKDCPEQPYCSKCRTRGHIPAKCPSKQQGNRPTHERHECQEEVRNQSHETRIEEWKRSQDQPKFSHKDNRYLHCASEYKTHDCPTRQQHQAPTTSNHARGTGIYQNLNQFPNTSPQHSSPSQPHSQQSQSTVGVTTPTLMVNNPQFQQGFQQQSPAPVRQVNQQANYQVRPQQFNQQFTQPSLPQVSPLLMPPQPFNSQVPPPYFPQHPPSNSPSVGSSNSSILVALQKQWEKQERINRECNDMERQKEKRKRMKEEREQKKEE